MSTAPVLKRKRPRKTPCSNALAGLRDPRAFTVWCRCCGQWEMVNGKPYKVGEGY